MLQAQFNNTFVLMLGTSSMNSKLTREGAAEDVKITNRHFHLSSVTFEHIHENKSCSACRERVKEKVKVVKVAKLVKVKVFQVFQNIPGSQLLSDVQTFLYSLFALSQTRNGYMTYGCKKTTFYIVFLH